MDRPTYYYRCMLLIQLGMGSAHWQATALAGALAASAKPSRVLGEKYWANGSSGHDIAIVYQSSLLQVRQEVDGSPPVRIFKE